MKEKESNLVKHARREFFYAGWTDKDGVFKDDMQKDICDNIISLLEVFGTQGHSGSTAPYVIDRFEKLAGFGVISPLRGTEDEWNDTGDGMLQNKRCSHVFKDPSGRAYDIQGKVFLEPDGSSYTSGDSWVDVDFPYTPKTEYVDVEKK